MLNTFEFSVSITNINSKWLSTFLFSIPYSWCPWSCTIFFRTEFIKKLLRLRDADSRAADLPTLSWRCRGGWMPSHLHTWHVGGFATHRVRNKDCKCQPIGNKESKNQPIGKKDDKMFKMWNAKFRMCVAIYCTHPWKSSQKTSNRSGIKHLRNLQICSELRSS